MGIPRSWEMLDRVPDAGTFKCTYVCAPTKRNFDLRRQLSRSYHFSDMKVPEKEVIWWTNSTEVPLEVIDLVLMIKEKKMDLNKVFDVIDGHDGNGEIGMGKLQQGLDELGWRAFKGPCQEHEVKEQYLSIFRCLNASGHGTMLKSDWNYLQEVLNDVEQSIKECLQYLLRISDNCWEEMWSKLDYLDEGSLDREQWLLALGRLGYGGPGDIVFRYATVAAQATTEAPVLTATSLRTLEKVMNKFT
mmetsp:Transcript_42879/g.70767  ORF Transcript_42879/g.70767 Transcript_42879/m.70767 type:complete len:246 (+) Transcript_42879:3-740(+)